MTALLWIAGIVAVYFFLKQFDTKKETKEMEENHHVEPFNTKKPYNPNAEVQELKFFYIKDKGCHASVWPKVDRFDCIEFTIAGITHYPNAAMKNLGESLAFLVAEPDNPYDSKAIKVMTSKWDCLGYVPRDMTDEIQKRNILPCPVCIYIGTYEDDEGPHFYTDAYIDLNYTKK